MGTTLEKDYQALVALTKEYLAQEFKKDTWVMASADTYAYFKELAKKARSSTPAVKTEAPALKPPQAPITQAAYAPAPPKAPLAKPEPVKAQTVQKAPPEPVQPIGLKTPSVEAYRPKSFELDPMKPAEPTDLTDIKQILEKHFPHIPYLEPLQLEEPIVCIYASDDIPEHLVFLQNVAKAISQLKAPTIVLSKSRSKTIPATVRLCLCQDETLINSNMSCLKIKAIPEYLRDPKQKAILWQEIRRAVAALTLPSI